MRNRSKPVIGITCSFHRDKDFFVGESYINSIEAAGGIPVNLPFTRDEDIEEVLRRVDGVLLTGGYDVDPYLYGEPPIPQMGVIEPKRDQFEVSLSRQAVNAGKSVLAICRGIQVFNVALGGTLYQDIYSQLKDLVKHVQQAPTYYGTHRVRIKAGSKLHRILGKEEVSVNSYHHQAVKDLGKSLTAVAWAEDGIIEAVEHDRKEFTLGVQWHPEHMIEGDMIKLFRAFVDETAVEFTRD